MEWNIYPRPQLRRKEWLNLNGEWYFNGSDSIVVPFCPESELSGVEGRDWVGKLLTYERSVSVPEEWLSDGKRIILHIGAADQKAEVYVNGAKLAEHIGGYLPFDVDITDSIVNGRADILIEVIDELDHRYGWGKQSLKRGGMWYTPVSGIWQSVWLEAVPAEYIRDIRIDCGLDWVEIRAYGVSSATLELGSKTYNMTADETGEAAYVRINIEEPHHWSPEDPYLYGFNIRTEADEVESYFALRTLTIEGHGGYKRLCLNGEPYFFNGLLDQGYWQNGIYTPESPAAFERDILAAKSLGFNMLRKHIKIEPEQFYYDCDRLGMVVFQDMVNNGDYSFFRDSALPTVGLMKRNDTKNVDEERKAIFFDEMECTVRHLYNHPSICYWTIFNEGWGQVCADEAYDRLKSLDSSRFIDSTSGWFEQSKSDVDSRHVYFRKLKLKTGDRPLVLSEFGGYACKLKEHCFNPDQTYGYRKCKNEAVLLRDLVNLYRNEIMPLMDKGLSAAVYTQISDVEDETNGFLTYDREVQKIKAYETTGRIELIGNHTDHQNGRTLSCPTKEKMRAYVADNHENVIRVFSEGFANQEISLDGEKVACEKGTEVALTTGVLIGFFERFGVPVLDGRGFDIYIDSEIPVGAGISSSAAYEVLIGRIINDKLFDGQATPVDIAKIGRNAENVYYGKPCGLQDQLTISLGATLLIDFAEDEPRYEILNCDWKGYELSFIETKSSHSGDSTGYSSIISDMHEVAEKFGADKLGSVNADEFMRRQVELEQAVFDWEITELQIDRACHFFAELERVDAGAQAIKDGRIEELISLIDQSGRSSEKLLQNILPEGVDENELSLAIAEARSDESIRAVKVQGGGFGGSILVVR